MQDDGWSKLKQLTQACQCQPLYKLECSQQWSVAIVEYPRVHMVNLTNMLYLIGIEKPFVYNSDSRAACSKMFWIDFSICSWNALADRTSKTEKCKFVGKDQQESMETFDIKNAILMSVFVTLFCSWDSFASVAFRSQ